MREMDCTALSSCSDATRQPGKAPRARVAGKGEPGIPTRSECDPPPERRFAKSLRPEGQGWGCGGPSAARHGPETRGGSRGEPRRGKPTDVGCTEIRETSALNPGGFLLIAKSEGERFQERE